MNAALLADKVAFVTGATRGIGLATAQAFAAAGAIVAMGGRNLANIKAAMEQVLQFCPGARLLPVVCDVGQEQDTKLAFQIIFREFKRLDVFVANAGILGDGLLGMVTRQQIVTVFSTNVFGAFHGAQYASRLMARHGGGSMIFLSSIMGTQGSAGQSVYSGSKAAIIGLVKSLAKELAPKNIRVNCIAPGFIDTDMTRSIPADKFAERAASIPMGRIGRPDEVANVSLFLASDLSGYVTGQVLGVDGGMLI